MQAQTKSRSRKAPPPPAVIVAVDPMDPPGFLLRLKDSKSKAAVSQEWDAFLTGRTTVQAAASAKVNWLKPRSLSDEDFEKFTMLRDQKKEAKLEKFKAKMATRIDTKGKRWDATRNRWVDEKTGEVAKPVHEEVKAIKQAAKAASKERKMASQAAKAARIAIPQSGILAEFQCRPDTNRARLLLTFEASLNKMVEASNLSKSVYGATDKLSPLVMVIKGAKDTIAKLKLPYELKDKAGASWGLFKAGAPVKTKAAPVKGKATKATKKGKRK